MAAKTNGRRPSEAALVEALGQHVDTIELLSERLAELELAMEDEGWQRLAGEGDREFSNEYLRRTLRRSRLMFLANPLINRAVNVQAYYVWGQGASFSARPDAVNDVVQAFLDHPKNQTELTSHQARTLKEVALQVSANLFLALFTNQSTGRVLVRSIPADEILAGDIITNPEDDKEPWYYKRVWLARTFDEATGEMGREQRTAYYPDWRHRPRVMPSTIGEHPVFWDTPVYHVKAGGLDDMRFGVPEHYSAFDWAKAVKQNLEDYATVKRVLARIAAQLITKGGKGAVAAAKKKLATTLGVTDQETNPPPTTGSILIGGEGNKLEPFRTSGAVASPDEGRRLGLMVAAGTGTPETILFGDAEVGNLATAKTLDRPTELKMRDRQTLWADVFTDLFGYIVEQAAVKPNGPLAGLASLEDQDEDGITTVLLPSDDDAGEPMVPLFDIDFPALLERDVTDRVGAVVAAATLDGKAPADTMDGRLRAQLLLAALGVDDVDELLDALFPDGAREREAPEAVPGGSAPEDQMAEAVRELREAILRIAPEPAPAT